ncbi:MAG: hypothetical protein WC915_05020 [archaeon]|jgi:hypothetical protein
MRKINSPRLSGNKPIRIKTIGNGQQGVGESVKRTLIGNVQTAEKHFHESIVEKMSLKSRKRVFMVWEKPNDIVADAILAQKVWFAFYKAGLPVPRFSKIDLRGKSKTFLSRYMEDMGLRHGELTDGHLIGKPREDIFNNVKKDPKLIKFLARDLATIYNSGYFSSFMDFWHFYKLSNKKLDRVILDFESFEKLTLTKNNLLTEVSLGHVKHNVNDMKQALGLSYNVFRIELLKKVKNPAIRKLINEFK